jgi:hypothetical protein
MKRLPKIKRDCVRVTREDGSHPYQIHCIKCDFFTTAITGNGILFYKDAVKLANKHAC